MPLFADYQVEVAPFWARQPLGERWLRSHGAMKDQQAEAVRESVLARCPLLCPADALELIGAERGLPRYPTDTEASYRDRLWRAWEVWQWAGTPRGVLNELVRAFGDYRPFVLVTQQGREWRQTSMDPADIEFHDTGQRTFQSPNFWNSFQLWMIYPLPFDPLTPDNSPEADIVRDILKRWKSGHSIVDRIVIQNDVHSSAAWGQPWSADQAPTDYDGTRWGDTNRNWGPTDGPYYWTPPT